MAKSGGRLRAARRRPRAAATPEDQPSSGRLRSGRPKAGVSHGVPGRAKGQPGSPPPGGTRAKRMSGSGSACTATGMAPRRRAAMRH